MASSIKGISGEFLSETMDNVKMALAIAGERKLEIEVIATAMIYLKENPEASINEALEVGLSDWDV